MFVAWRDLRFARGRFALIGAVVALITLLVGFLSGLTAGLAARNISAITGIDAERMVFSEPASATGTTYADSAVTASQLSGWQARPGVRTVSPLGISQVKAYAGQRQTPVAVLGAGAAITRYPAASHGHVNLSRTAARDLGIAAGGTVRIGGTGYRVDAVTPDAWYSHTAVVWATLPDWRAVAATSGNSGAFATVFAVRATGTDFAAADVATGTTSLSVPSSLTAIGSFRSEIGSLLLMVGLLFGISALVVGAFFTVWGMQRQGDVAILKALGASTRMLVGDALGQAAVILVGGVGIGISLTAIFASLLGDGLPFVLSPLTTVLPGTAMVALGLFGAALALRSVTRADPLHALGSTR